MSRKYRSIAQWLELIEVFELSGQSQVEFCAEHDLNPAYFSKRRGELLKAQSEPAFVQVQSRSSCSSAVSFDTSLTLRLHTRQLCNPVLTDSDLTLIEIKIHTSRSYPI